MALLSPWREGPKQPGWRFHSILTLGTEQLLGLWPGQRGGLSPPKTNVSFGKGSDIPLNIPSSAVPLESPFPKPQGSASAPLQCRRFFGNWGLRLVSPASDTPQG